MIHHVRETTGKPVGIKAAIGQTAWLDEFCQRIHELGLDRAPDFFTIDNADGGTGAAPQSLMDLMGLPVRRSLPIVVDKKEPRLLNRSHAQMISERGLSKPLMAVYPDPETQSQYRHLQP